MIPYSNQRSNVLWMRCFGFSFSFCSLHFEHADVADGVSSSVLSLHCGFSYCTDHSSFLGAESVWITAEFVWVSGLCVNIRRESDQNVIFYGCVLLISILPFFLHFPHAIVADSVIRSLLQIFVFMHGI